MVIRDVEDVDGRLAKVLIDYMYLHERAGPNKQENYNPPQLIMIDHKSGRVWSYRIPNKGIMEGASWLFKRMVQDLDNCGYADIRIQLE